jgi:hypothetical protein
MKMSPSGKTQIEYLKVFAALGQFIAKKDLSDICVMEFEGGMIVTGSRLYETGETLGRRTETHVFSVEDLRRLVKEG